MRIAADPGHRDDVVGGIVSDRPTQPADASIARLPQTVELALEVAGLDDAKIAELRQVSDDIAAVIAGQAQADSD